MGFFVGVLSLINMIMKTAEVTLLERVCEVLLAFAKYRDGIILNSQQVECHHKK